MVTKKLAEMLKKYENDCDGYELEVDGIELEEAIEKVLKESSTVSKYDIHSATMFDSPGYTCGYVAVAWIENDTELHSEVYDWEVY